MNDNTMNKRIFGVIGISAFMANWNADFSGLPKTTSSGDIFGSDKALKYTIKKMWEEEEEKILYLRTMMLAEREDRKALVPRSLRERYEFLFGPMFGENGENQDTDVLRNLFSATDVKQFGATVAVKDESKGKKGKGKKESDEKNGKTLNIGITGAVQFGQGLNKYRYTDVVEQEILSPFRDSKISDSGEDTARFSTIGKKIVTNEAHYFYPFAINPLAYKDFVELGVTEGYTEKDYESFKKAVISSVTAYASNSKMGCDNEFALFIETEPEAYIPTLTKYICFEKETGEEKAVIRFTKPEIFEKESVQKAEVYHDPSKISLDRESFKGNAVSFIDIVTGEEI